jgi:hypothetical protein
MKLHEQDRIRGGFRVSFEMLKGKMLYGQTCPFYDEVAFQTFDDALDMCKEISKIPTAYNIHPIHAIDFSPVKDYKQFELNRR